MLCEAPTSFAAAETDRQTDGRTEGDTIHQDTQPLQTAVSVV